MSKELRRLNLCLRSSGCANRLTELGIFAAQLKRDKVDELIRQHVQSAQGMEEVRLKLSIGFGPPLFIDAVRVIPEPDEIYIKHGFSVYVDDDKAFARPYEMRSPPLIPMIDESKMKQLQKDVWQWVDDMIRDPENDWQDSMFAGNHEDWECDMLNNIRRFYLSNLAKVVRKDGPWLTMRAALTLTVLNCIMGRAFLVPADAIPELFRTPPSNVPSEDFCPRVANRVIKHWLLPVLDRQVKDLLSGLYELFWYNKRPEIQIAELWDLLFSAVCLSLIIIGKTQVALLERAKAGEMQGDLDFTFTSCLQLIDEMNRGLGSRLIEMFHKKLGTNKKGGSFNPLDQASSATAMSDLVRDLRATIQLRGKFDYHAMKEAKLTERRAVSCRSI